MAKNETMVASAEQALPSPYGEWSDALVLVALGRAIAENHAPILREPVPTALNELLQQLAGKGSPDGEK